MSWTKRDFVQAAHEEIGLGEYAFDAEPEELQSALRKLDALMALWNKKGVKFGYPLPARPQDSDLDEDTNAPDELNEAIYQNLAIRLAPSHGKTPSADLRKLAKTNYNFALGQFNKPIESKPKMGMPSGQGNRQYQDSVYDRFSRPEDTGQVDKPTTTIGFQK